MSHVEPPQDGSTSQAKVGGTWSRRFHRVRWIGFLSWNLVWQVPLNLLVPFGMFAESSLMAQGAI